MKTPNYWGPDIFTRVTAFKSSRFQVKKTMMKQNNPEEEAKLELKSQPTRVTWHF